MRYLANVVSLAFDAARCTGCGRCWEVCPHGVFAADGSRSGPVKARLVDRDLCIECGACELNCRTAAIRVKSGTGCAAAIISGALRGTDPSCGCGGGKAGEEPGCCG